MLTNLGSRVAYAALALLLSACGPRWPHASFSAQSLCMNAKVYDRLLRVSLTGVSEPTKMKTQLAQEEQWYTPVDLKIRTVAWGPKTDVMTVVYPFPLDEKRELTGLAVDGAEAWFFVRETVSLESKQPVYWVGGADFGIVMSDGRVVFPNAEHKSEAAFLDAAVAARGDPNCQFDTGLVLGK